ncbi:MAG: hypothetical protein R2778_19300 [Saprospiraceae bacterium]
MALLNIPIVLSDSTFSELIEEKNTEVRIDLDVILNCPGSFYHRNRDFSHKLLDEGRVLIQIHSVESLARQYTKRLIVKPLSFLSSVLEMQLREPNCRRAADIPEQAGCYIIVLRKRMNLRMKYRTPYSLLTSVCFT